jgi:hypothetical protein
LRNDAAHGRLDAVVTRDQVADLMAVVRALLALSDTDADQSIGGR